MSGSAPHDRGDAADAHSLSDRDQSTADADQSISDLDQTSSDADQTASERDQLASERDQQAADADQALSDSSGNDHPKDYARSREARSRSARERDITSVARSETARIRDDAAAARDRLADERDAAARERDELAARLDAEAAHLELDPRAENGNRMHGAELLMRAAGQRKRMAAARARSAALREAAARDREQAAHDRRQAALDREAAAVELAAEGVDHLTGALRRRVGLAAMQRELDRTDRSGEGLVIAFVDIVGLKAVNDGEGHGAGDDLLLAVAEAISGQLRRYDLVARYGGDEFVCSLTGLDEAGARGRFDQIAGRLPAKLDRPVLTVGFAERRDGEALADLIQRADLAMLEARRASDA